MHSKMASTPISNFLSPNTPGISSPLASAVPSPTSAVHDWDHKSGEGDGIKMGEGSSGESNSGTVIKIGQTALHNPDGRGSWTGL